MEKLKVLSLFAGIGGFDLGLERTGGFETVAVCEIDPFCRSVLARHWPKARQYEDVRELTGDVLRRDGIEVDVICGGFPCQDISHAGNQQGIGEGTRSGLYAEVIRLIREVRPVFTLMENVAALLSGPSDRPGWWMGRVLGDLAAIRHDAEWHRIRAGTCGLPQERGRIWLLAYPDALGLKAPVIEAPLPNKAGAFREWEQVELYGTRSGNTRWLPVARNWRVDNGVPSQLDIARTGAIGNAVTPLIPEIFGRAMLKALERTRAAA